MKKFNRMLAISLTALLAVSSMTSTCFAAGKTIYCYKANNYTGTSDAKTMYDGVRGQVSSYTGGVKTSNITSSDFYDKTKCIKYWASHGYNSRYLTGDHMTGFYYTNNFKWSGGNLEFAFLAACNQLDGNGSNPRATYANAMLGSSAVRTVCGYHEYAPAAGPNGDAKVAQYFINYAKTGESVKSSWILANTDFGDLDYCVLTHSGDVQYSRFEGFPGLTYTRPGSSSSTILRFTSLYPNGTTQPTTISAETPIELQNDLAAQLNVSLPNYSIKATPVNTTVKETVDTTVLANDSGLKTLNGEIKDTEISMSDNRLESIANEWVNSTYTGIDATDFSDKDVVISEIKVAEVNLDGDASKEDEKTVAYHVRYNNKFNGIPVKGDHFYAIIDDSGVVSSSINHNDYQIVANTAKANAISSNDAASFLAKEIESNAILAAASTSVTGIGVSFCDDDGDGIFDPAYVFEMADGNTYTVNSLSGAVSF